MPYSSRTAIHEQLTPNEGVTFTEFAWQLAMPIADIAEVRAPQAVKAPQRSEPAIEWHNRLREMDDAARGRQAPRRTSTREVRPAPGVYGMPLEVFSERYLPAMGPGTLARSLAESTARDFTAADDDPWAFAWRESVTMAEFINGDQSRSGTV